MTEQVLRKSTPQQEGSFNASKWLKHQLLVSEKSMSSLLEELKGCFLCHASGLVETKNAFISLEEFFEKYKDYICAIQQGRDVDEKQLRRFFCNYLTYDLSCLYAIDAPQDKVIIKVSRPVVQMQFHHFLASSIDGKFHSMVMSQDSIHFGIQFSYPQIFEDPKSHQFYKVTEETSFPNTLLFKKIIKWLRTHTMPAPVLFMGNKTRAPYRIDKQGYQWINAHPQMQSKGIKIEV